MDKRGSIPDRNGTFLFPASVSTHCLSYPLGTGRGLLFIEGVAAVREADHSLPSSAEIKNEWIFTSTPHMRLTSLYKDSFIL
jgi:hypothetical protein